LTLCQATVAVGAEVANELPYALLAVTVTLSVRPTSGVTGIYDKDVAPAMRVQLAPFVSQRDHAYANEVGRPDHVPLEEVRVFPSWATPVMTGACVLLGAELVTGRVSHHLRTPGTGSPKTALLQATPPVNAFGAVNLPFAP
jgi:hypothetical protein